MRVHHLRLVNFRQHEDTRLAFDEGLTGIIGPNGSGKTTLLEALAWAMYGSKATRGTVATLRRRNAPPRARVEVELEFSLGAHRYRVTRGLHGAELYQDGDPAPIANSGAAVSERLTRMLGMTREEFFRTYFTGQKELAILGAMGPTERGQFLSRVLGYERLKRCQERLKEERRVLQARLHEVEARLVSPDLLAAEEAQAGRWVVEATGATARAAAARVAAAARLEAARPEWERVQALQERVRSLETDLRVADKDVTSAGEAHQRLDRDLAEALGAQTQLAKLAPALEDLPALQAERDRLETAAREMARWRERAGQAGELRRRLEALDRQLAALPPPQEEAELRAALAAASARAREAEEALERQRLDQERKLQEARTQLDHVTAQYRDLETQRDRLRDAGPEGDCPTCGRPLGASYQEVMDHLGGHLSELTFNGRFFRSQVKQLAAQPAGLAAAALARDQARAEVARVSETLGRAAELDQARRRQQGERDAEAARLQALEAELAGRDVAYDEARHAAVRARLAELEPIREEVARYRGVAERAAGLTSEMAATEAALSAHEARRRGLQEALAGAGWSETAFLAAKAALEAADRSRQEAELEGARAEHATRMAAQERETVRRKREERERGAADAARLGHAIRLNQLLHDAFGDLRTDLNDTMRPDLSELGSRFLRDLTLGRYTELELDDAYAPAVLEDGEPQPVLSGGEEDVVSLALRLAISQLIAERAGQPLSLLILDEIFGSLDEERRTAVLDLLRGLADRFRQVILITHIEAVREGVDRVLRLEYDVEHGVARVREEAAEGGDAEA